MTLGCKLYCQNCVICNKAKLDRRGGASLHPLGIPEYPWYFFGIDYVTDLIPKSSLYGHTAFLLWFVTLLRWLICSMPQGNHCRRLSRCIYK
jgi:hypothetical protein